MPLWFQTETRVRTHPKMVRAGRAACWTWLAGNCYAKDQMTDGFIPDGMLASLVPGASAREIKKDADALVAAGLWHKATGGYSINDYLEYNDSKADILAARERDRKRKKKGVESDEIPDGIPEESGRPLISISGSSSGSKKEDQEKKPHPIKDLLAYHEQCFTHVTKGDKPAKYTAGDAKHAKELIDRHGYDKARSIVRQAFVSADKFIAESGRSMGFIASSSVQNRLIAELAAKKTPGNLASTEEHPHLKKLAEMGVTHG